MENRKIYFIDVIYYNCFSFYRRYEKDLNEFSGQALTAACLSLNVIAILTLIQEIFNFIIFENKWYTTFVSIPILLFTILRYSKHISIIEIEDALYNKERHQIKRLNLIACIYILISIFGTILGAVILGELNNPPPFWDSWFN
jgi:hypothetical protein